MTLFKLQFRPGVNKDQTNYSTEGGWVDSDKVRFRMGQPQKIGGWKRVNSNKFLGVCRQMFRWVTSYSESLLALGTNTKVYIEYGGVYHDVTPLRASFTSTDTDDCITLYDGSNELEIAITAHGALSGDYLRIAGVDEAPLNDGTLYAIPLAEINKEHRVVRVIDVDTFIIAVDTPADLGGTPTIPSLGGSNINVEFDIHVGKERTLPGYGWGTGTWGRGSWSSQIPKTTKITQQDWWFDRFYNDLIANLRFGPIYYWERGSTDDPTSALATRIGLLSDRPNTNEVPDQAMQILVAQDNGHLIAFGCTTYGANDFDPLLIRWASQDEPTEWEPKPENSSGFLRVSRGRRIQRALPTRQEILVWTESSLSALQYLGTSDVFGLQTYADNISLASPRAPVEARNIVYWMGRGQFYAYSGRVEPLPCTMQEYVFNQFNFAQAEQVFAATNELHHEVWWFYPSKGSTKVDKYVVFNYMEGVWYGGSMSRTAWLDSQEMENPQAVGYEGYIFNHEVGADADKAPMYAYIQSADIAITDGNPLLLTKRIIPDVEFRGSNSDNPSVLYTVRPRDFPGSGYIEDPHDNANVIQHQIDQYTNQIFIRARARHLALRLESDGLGVHWRMGDNRVDARPSGRR